MHNLILKSYPTFVVVVIDDVVHVNVAIFVDDLSHNIILNSARMHRERAGLSWK